ncbi:MAG: tol-pal system-associated acyl-CoA thioesterase [Ectothiorhodospiraceae bacterium]
MLTEAVNNPDGSFRWTVRVYYEDTDSGGLVYHTSYLRYMERARTEWLRALGFDQGRLKTELGVLFAVRSLDIRYLQPAVLDDHLAVDSRAARHRRAGLRFDQHISRLQNNGPELCRASVEVVCIDAHTRRPRPIPEAIMTEMGNVG